MSGSISSIPTAESRWDSPPWGWKVLPPSFILSSKRELRLLSGFQNLQWVAPSCPTALLSGKLLLRSNRCQMIKPGRKEKEGCRGESWDLQVVHWEKDRPLLESPRPSTQAPSGQGLSLVPVLRDVANDPWLWKPSK